MHTLSMRCRRHTSKHFFIFLPRLAAALDLKYILLFLVLFFANCLVSEFRAVYFRLRMWVTRQFAIKNPGNANVERVSRDDDVMRCRIPTTFPPCTSSSTKLKMDTGRTEAKYDSLSMMPNFPATLGKATPPTRNSKTKFCRMLPWIHLPCTKYC